MKKLLVVFLALMMILSVALVACGDKNEPDPDPNLEDENDFIPNGSSVTTGAEAEEGNDDPEGTKAPSAGDWTNETGTIYVRANGVNIRAASRKNSTVIGTANFGDSFQYEAFNDDYYQIKYEGATAYISSTFVDGNKNTVTFEEHATLKAGTVIKITTGNKCNLRSDPAAAESTLKGTIDDKTTANGELTIVKINKTGTWAEVRFKGVDTENRTFTGNEVLYCTTGYIAELAGNNNTNNNHG